MENKNLQDGYYWLKFKSHITDSKWRVCFCYGTKIIYDGSIYCINTDLEDIRTKRLEEPEDMSEVPVLKPTNEGRIVLIAFDKQGNRIPEETLKDLTKPAGHGMNPFIDEGLRPYGGYGHIAGFPTSEENLKRHNLYGTKNKDGHYEQNVKDTIYIIDFSNKPERNFMESTH